MCLGINRVLKLETWKMFVGCWVLGVCVEREREREEELKMAGCVDVLFVI